MRILLALALAISAAWGQDLAIVGGTIIDGNGGAGIANQCHSR